MSGYLWNGTDEQLYDEGQKPKSGGECAPANVRAGLHMLQRRHHEGKIALCRRTKLSVSPSADNAGYGMQRRYVERCSGVEDAMGIAAYGSWAKRAQCGHVSSPSQ